MMPTGKASGNAVLAKARALYGSRLRADDYRRLMACRTMTELAAALKEYPLYSEALAEVNPQYARRVQLENLLRQSLYTRYDSLCRYDRSAGSKVYEYFTLCCEVDELTAAMRCLDAGRPGDYLFRLPRPSRFCRTSATAHWWRWPPLRAAQALRRTCATSSSWNATPPLFPTPRGSSASARRTRWCAPTPAATARP